MSPNIVACVSFSTEKEYFCNAIPAVYHVCLLPEIIQNGAGKGGIESDLHFKMRPV
jgi:hypothetical protein